MNRIKITLYLFVVSIFVFSHFTFLKAQEKVRISPKALVQQTVGLTDVSIEYSRPGVKDRTIWGGLVPYNVVWRAGANEATKIIFSSNVTINGKKLKAGSYGFFTIPTKNYWTLIFNKVAEQWGAFEYNEAEDALRVEIKPEEGYFQEWLAYTITKTSDYSAVVMLEWEKLKVPFTVEAE
jgi:hypothetical protein